MTAEETMSFLPSGVPHYFFCNFNGYFGIFFRVGDEYRLYTPYGAQHTHRIHRTLPTLPNHAQCNHRT